MGDVIDLDALAAAEKENWVWHGADCLKPEYERCLVQLSRGGADADVVREFDLHVEDVGEGRLLPARGQEQRGLARPRHALRRHRLRPGLDDDLGLPADRQGCGSAARRWRRRRRVFEGQPDDISRLRPARPHEGLRARLRQPRGDVLLDEMFLRRDGKLGEDREARRRDRRRPPRPAAPRAARPTGPSAARRTPPAPCSRPTSTPSCRGERRFEVLFEPTERKSLAGVPPTLHHLLAQRARQRQEPALRADAGEDGKWTRAPLPGMPEFGDGERRGGRRRRVGRLLLTVTDFLTPTSLSLGDRRQGGPPRS